MDSVSLRSHSPSVLILAAALGWVLPLRAGTQEERPRPASDAVLEAQSQKALTPVRPEQRKTDHDRSDVFEAKTAPPSSGALKEQVKEGKNSGFDFYRDPLNSDRPGLTAEEIMAHDSAARPKVMDMQRKLLESRYILVPKFDPEVKMSRGKPVCVGPTVRLPEGMTLEKLGALAPGEIRARDLFPYPPLPHPLQATGGQVFPKMQIDMFPRLERFDVDHDLPEAFLPEFPPALFLSNRPELGDVSRGEVISINNFYRLFKDILTPVQLNGLQFLVTPFPQEEFNPTDDRKSRQPSLGVACFDCHVNGHTTGQFHLNPDDRPQERRLRLDTTSLRGLFNQQIHSSKRSLRSVEDFTEFEQRTAYFNGDPIHAMKKGFIQLDRVRVSHMAQFQNMIDFPPASKLNPMTGMLDPKVATELEMRGQTLFFGKAQCAVCHPAPFYLDHLMHDLHLERFLKDPGDGPMKTFTLRGLKDSPPYFHDGRCFTIEDTVEIFNLIQELKLSEDEKKSLAAFLKCL